MEPMEAISTNQIELEKITSKPSEEDVFKEMTPPSLGHPVTCIKPMDTSNAKKNTSFQSSECYASSNWSLYLLYIICFWA